MIAKVDPIINPDTLMTDDEDTTPMPNRKLRFQSPAMKVTPVSAMAKKKPVVQPSVSQKAQVQQLGVSEQVPMQVGAPNTYSMPVQLPFNAMNPMLMQLQLESDEEEEDWLAKAISEGSLGNDSNLIALFKKRQIQDDKLQMKRRAKKQQALYLQQQAMYEQQQAHQRQQEEQNNRFYTIMNQMSTTQNRQVVNEEEKKTSKTMFKKLRETQRTDLIRGSAPRASVEPTCIVPSCERLFEATNTHAGFLVVKEMMSNCDATAEYSPLHLEALAKTGCLWEDINIPELLTLFAIFPIGSRAQKMIKSAKARVHQVNCGLDLKEEDVTFMANLHLYAPQTAGEAMITVRTFLSLLRILFGEGSFLFHTFNFHRDWFEKHQRPFVLTSNQGKLLTTFLYDTDRHVQMFLKDISDPDVPMPRPPFEELKSGLAHIRYMVGKGYHTMDLPAIFNLKGKDATRRVFRNNDEDLDPDDKVVVKNQAVQQPKQVQQKQEQAKGKNANQKAKQPKDAEGMVRNPRMNEAWRLPRHVNIGDLLRAPDMPMHNGKFLCVMYHCMGKCSLGHKCPHFHNDPREIGLESVVDAFCLEKFGSAA